MSTGWGYGLPSSLTVDGKSVHLSELKVLEVGSGWSMAFGWQGPRCVLHLWQLNGAPMAAYLYHGDFNKKPVQLQVNGVPYQLDRFSGWMAYSDTLPLKMVTSASNRLDLNMAAADAAQYEDQPVHAITGSGNVDFYSQWYEYTKPGFDGWSPTAAKFACEYLAMQARRPEHVMWPYGTPMAGLPMCFYNAAPDLHQHFTDPFEKNSQGLGRSDPAHFDTKDFYEIGTQCRLPFADMALVERVALAMNSDFYWQPSHHKYGGQTRTAAWLLMALHFAIIRADEAGLRELSARLRARLDWHVEYILSIFPWTHPWYEGGGHDLMKAEQLDYFPCWQFGALGFAADLIGQNEETMGSYNLTSLCLDWLEEHSWNPTTGEVFGDVSFDYKVSSPATDTATWPLCVLYRRRPSSPLTKRLLELVPKEILSGKYMHFGSRLFGPDLQKVQSLKGQTWP